MEDMVITLFGEPSSCFFDSVTVGDAVNNNGGVFHFLE
jgi:hypothetical protein